MVWKSTCHNKKRVLPDKRRTLSKCAITDLTVNPYVGIIRIRFMGRGRTSSQQPFFNGITLPDIQFLNCVLL